MLTALTMGLLSHDGCDISLEDPREAQKPRKLHSPSQAVQVLWTRWVADHSDTLLSARLLLPPRLIKPKHRFFITSEKKQNKTNPPPNPTKPAAVKLLASRVLQHFCILAQPGAPGRAGSGAAPRGRWQRRERGAASADGEGSAASPFDSAFHPAERGLYCCLFIKHGSAKLAARAAAFAYETRRCRLRKGMISRDVGGAHPGAPGEPPDHYSESGRSAPPAISICAEPRGARGRGPALSAHY